MHAAAARAGTTRGRRWWALSSGLSVGLHAAVVAAALALHFQAPLAPATPTELQIVSPEPARPQPGGAPGAQAQKPGATSVSHHHRAPTPQLALPIPAAPLEPVADEQDVAMPVPEGAAAAEGDDDGGDGPDVGGGPGGARAGTGTGGGSGPPSLTSAGPQPISSLEAAYLRTYQTLPTVPPSVWQGKHVYTVVTQICVSREGRVVDVILKKGAEPGLDQLVVAAERTWRYRSRTVNGKPIAFCHPMTLHYDPN